MSRKKSGVCTACVRCVRGLWSLFAVIGLGCFSLAYAVPHAPVSSAAIPAAVTPAPVKPAAVTPAPVKPAATAHTTAATAVVPSATTAGSSEAATPKVQASPPASTMKHSANTLPKPQATTLQPLDRIVAIVNNDIITQAQLQQAVKQVQQQLAHAGTTMPPLRVLRRQVFEQQIMQSLQLQMAKRMGVQVGDKQVQDALMRVAKQNHLSLAELQQKLVQSGVDYHAYRKQIRQQLVIMQLQRMAVGRNISVSKQEIDTAYLQVMRRQPQQYHVGDILLALPESPSVAQLQAAQQKAAQIVQQLKQGKAQFKQLAAEHSDNQQAFKGGDMGWMTLTDMPSIFVPVLTKLQVGAVSAPLRAPNGLHILKLFNKRAVKGQLNKQQIEMQLRQRKFEEDSSIWLQQLRDSAYVKVFLADYKDLESK